MKYIDYFSQQWDNLVVDFKAFAEKQAIHGLSAKKVNDWFDTNAYRWESFSDNNGMLLRQQNNPELQNELISGIHAFSFKGAEIGKAPSFIPFLVIPLVICAAASVFLVMKSLISIWIALLGSFAILLGSFWIYGQVHDKYEKNTKKALCDAYATQLAAYKATVTGICKKYDK